MRAAVRVHACVRERSEKLRANQVYHGSEDDEQAAVFEWAELMEYKYPCLWLMYHVANGEKRDKATAAKLKRMGVKPGVCDIVLPAARGGYHGLYVEMKVGNNKPSPPQRRFMRALALEGYFVALAYGATEAIRLIERYVKGEERI